MNRNGNGKNRKKKPVVKKPYVQGTITDGNTVRNAFSFFGKLVLMAVVYLLLGSMMAWGNSLLRWIFNTAIIICGPYLFYLSGINRGTADVNQGEMLYDRQQRGSEISESERRASFHKGKGIMIAMLGSLPLLIMSVLFAIIAKKQYSTIGLLPSWVSALQNRADVGDALLYYRIIEPLNLEQILRIVVRVALLPCVNLVAPYGADALLWLERISPVILLLPGLCYGFGYTKGPGVRDEVHSEIAANARRKKKKNKKPSQPWQLKEPGQNRQKQRAPKGPGQLN